MAGNVWRRGLWENSPELRGGFVVLDFENVYFSVFDFNFDLFLNFENFILLLLF